LGESLENLWNPLSFWNNQRIEGCECMNEWCNMDYGNGLDIWYRLIETMTMMFSFSLFSFLRICVFFVCLSLFFISQFGWLADLIKIIFDKAKTNLCILSLSTIPLSNNFVFSPSCFYFLKLSLFFLVISLL